MSSLCKLLTLFLVVIGMNLAVVEDADARRLGGGGSFGKRSTTAGRSASAPRTPSQQAAFNKNQQIRQQLSQRGGFMGLLGGLALGGLLGALFFGGAFEGINFLDILLFAGIAFLLLKLLVARQRAQMQGQGAGGPGAGLGPDAAFRGAAGPSADPAAVAPGTGLSTGSGRTGPDADFPDEPEHPHQRPADFDEQAFVAGAVRAFKLLQESWNDQDLSEIRGLTTDAMFGHIQDQHRDGSVDAYVQVLDVSAKVLDARQIGTTQEASVLFDAVLRESHEDRPAQVREIWHFTREAGSRSATWYLDGIEQLED